MHLSGKCRNKDAARIKEEEACSEKGK